MKLTGIKTRPVSQVADAARWLRIGGWCGMLAGPLYLGVISLIDWLRPDYSWVAAPVSYLGRSGVAYSGAYNVGLALTGLLVAVFAWGLYLSLGPAAYGWLAPALVAFFGLVGLTSSAYFHCDAICSDESIRALLHYPAAIFGVAAMIWGLVQLVPRFASDPAWAEAVVGTRWAAHLSMLCLVLFDLGATAPGAPLRAYLGLSQRLYFGLTFGWMFWIGGKLVKKEKDKLVRDNR